MKIFKKKNLPEVAGKKRFWKRRSTKIGLGIVFTILGLVIIWLITGYSMVSKIFTGNFSGGMQILKLLTHSSDPLKGQSDGRINILLMGYGDPGHAGDYLTDTIQLVSIDTKNNKMAMLSIPRDLFVETKNPNYSGKINAIYKSGKPYDPKSKYDGATLLKGEVGAITDLPIHYYASIDFNGFKKAIDQIGGVDVTIDRSFTDYTYPAGECNETSGTGCSVKTVSFKAGNQHMDGATALIFARSRHALGPEGSDFARSLRQQKVLASFKNKSMSQGILDNPVKVMSLINILSSSLRTDMQPTEIKSLATLLKTIDTSNIISKVLDTSPDGLLIDYIGSDFQPKAGLNNFSQIQSLAKNIFNSENVIDYSVKINISNGSQLTGQASSLATTLKNYGFTSISVDKTTQVEKTVIYDYTGGAKKGALDFLAKQLNCDIIQKTKTSSITYDISIIIGNNYKDISGNLKESPNKQSNT